MTDTTNFTLDDMLRKVQAMLARADHPNTPVAEAETSRRMAEAMMLKYRIDEAMLAATGGLGASGDTLVPIWRHFVVCSTKSEFATYYRMIAQACLRHVDCEFVTKNGPAWEANEDLRGTPEGEQWVYYMEAVGYESDLRIAEVLYTNAMLAFQTRLEPKYDPTLTEQVNAYLMRSAGMEGWRIAEMIYGRTDKSLRPKVRKMFKDEAIARGEDPSVLLGKGNDMKGYRLSFAEGFYSTIYSRLNQMRLAQADADSGALVLASRATNVREALYARYPKLRPVTGASSYSKPANHGCPKCEKAKSGYCRDHSYLKPRSYRSSGPSYNYEAAARGGAAAKAADLGATPAGRRVDGNGPRGEL